MHGLRALCICQVMAFHAWGIGTPLAVDIFVILSSFLLTSSFLKRFEAGVLPNLFERWMHFFKRLTPPVVATVGGTILLTFTFLPLTFLPDLIAQGWAAIFGYQNWLLAAEAVDYFAAHDEASSPLMHLWYVAIQAQVYVVVPLVLTLLYLATRSSRRWIRPLVAAVFALVAVALFLWTIHAIDRDGISAVYFDTRSRAWEFALGCVIAAARPWVSRINPHVAAAACWTGLGVLIYLGVDRHDSYPGPLALVTVAGSGALMLWGDRCAAWGPRTLLALPPFQWLGNRSYAIYLVHWPILATYMAAVGVYHLGVLEALALLVIAVALAGLLTELVDDPVHYSRWVNASMWHKCAVVALAFAVGAAGMGTMTVKMASWRERATALSAQAGDATYPGALTLSSTGPVPDAAEAIPAPLGLDDQWMELPKRCTGPFANPPRVDSTNHTSSCRQLPLIDDAAANVVIIGDSHAQQYAAGWIDVATERRWNLGNDFMGGCMFTTPEHSFYSECETLNEQRLEWVEKIRPDIVIMVVTRTSETGTDYLMPGVEDIVARLDELGITVVGLRDNPRFGYSMYDCDQRGNVTSGHLAGCSAKVESVYAEQMPDDALDRFAHYLPVDTAEMLCPDGVCWSIIGNVYVYLDLNHLTKDYASTLDGFFADKTAVLAG
nr:acyltransferase family protein [Nanchangia anserum]